MDLTEGYKKRLQELAGIDAKPTKERIALGDLMVDVGNMDSAYYKAQKSDDEPSSFSSSIWKPPLMNEAATIVS